MTVVDGWYSAALVVKYTVGDFRHYLFFQKVCGLLSQEGHVYRSIQRHIVACGISQGNTVLHLGPMYLHQILVDHKLSLAGQLL